MSTYCFATFILEHFHTRVVDEPHFDELTNGRKNHETDHENRTSIEPRVEPPANSHENGDREGHFHALAHSLVDIA